MRGKKKERMICLLDLWMTESELRRLQQVMKSQINEEKGLINWK